MYLNNKDLEILKDIELYLYNNSMNNTKIYNNNFIVKQEDIKDHEALQLYFKLYSIIEDLEAKRKDNIEKVNAKNKTTYRLRHKLNNKISYLRLKTNKTEQDQKLYKDLLEKRKKLNEKSLIKNINDII